MTSVLLTKSAANKSGDQELLTSKEEASAFLTFTAGGEDVDGRSTMNSAEQGLCQRRRRFGLCGGYHASICLLVLVALLGISVLCLELYRGREAAALRSELATLRRDVDSLKHRLVEQDLMNDLKAFEDAVYAEEAATDDDETEDDGADDDDESEDDDEGDVDYYVEDEDEDKRAPADRRGKFHARYEEIFSNLKSKSEAHGQGRAKREILSGVDSSVPVIAESYGAHNKTGGSEGLRLYETLVAGGARAALTETTESPIKKHHRVSPLWSAKQHKKMHPEGSQITEHQVYHNHRHRAQSLSATTQTPSPIITRQSRVMDTDTNAGRRQSSNLLFHTAAKQTTATQRPDGEVVVWVHQEQKSGPAATVRASDVQGQPIRRRKIRPTKKVLANYKGISEQEQVAPGRRRMLSAAHFSGNSTHYESGHEHYEGNGRLRHPAGIFMDWTPSSWMKDLEMDRQFNYGNGAIDVKDSGLYFVYAQIHFLDEHDINGFRIFVNEVPMLQCTTMSHTASNSHALKSNTCYTGAVLFLKADSQLSIRDIESMRYSVFQPMNSFFGLIKLGRAKIK